LDGIPLAVELAAARTRMLSIEHIVERLDDRFRLLTEGGRTAPARHRTLRAAIDWSYELLPDAERQLFARLSIFSGGWTLDAAEDVCGESGLLDLLGHLASKSFVSVERGDDPRYRMLETLREYAAERLDPAERAALARRHADVFVRLVEKAQTKANGPEEVPWFDRLEREQDNVRAAFDWSMSTDGDVDVGIRIALASQPFLYRR